MLALISAVEIGFIYALLALGVFLSFRTLDIPDLTVDGSIVTGAAASAILCSNGYNPILALALSFILGTCAGIVTGLLNTKLKIQPLLAGILVMLGVYSINLRIMGGSPNIPLVGSETIYTKFNNVFDNSYSSLLLGFLVIAGIILVLYLFLETRFGLAFRSTGENNDMVKAYGIDSDLMKIFGLGISNGLVGLAGGMLCQYQSFADISMGTGMVVTGLASVIIGEIVFGTSSLIRKLVSVALGAILYRVIISLAFSLGMPASDLKLVSAVIVTIALAMGLLADNVSFRDILKKGGKRNA